MILIGTKSMANIYNFLKNVWLKAKDDKSLIPLVFLCLFLVTIPLTLAINNIALLFFVVSALTYGKYYHLKSTSLVSILIFIVLSCSYFWSIDPENTLKNIPRAIFFLVIPMAFTFLKPFSASRKETILKSYAYGMLVLVIFFLARALVRFLFSQNPEVFFYHGASYEVNQGLVPKELNAIHVSVFVSLAYFILLYQSAKNKFDYLVLGVFTIFIVLLSSKNIIIIFGLLNLIYIFYFSTSAYKMRLRNLLIFVGLVGVFLSFTKIKDRIAIEFADHSTKSVSHHVIHNIPESVNILSIREAWEKKTFTPNDYFPGTAFRVYQFRLFLDFLKEDQIFWKGFGYEAAQSKIQEKGKQYNVFLGDDIQEGYQQKNFHNQFIQIFAESGVIGLLLLLLMLAFLLRQGIQHKDFLTITFVVLMISVFLTESFLWRQRGMVFFVTFYCLFLSNKSLKNSLEN
jgi:O-antigen ligase